MSTGVPRHPSGEAVRDTYAGLARRYDERWERYVESSVGETLRRLELAPGQSVLDVGCGTGALLCAIQRVDPSARLLGVDLTPAMLRVAAGKRHPDTGLAAADAVALPFAAASFDLVVSTSSLHYWTDPVAGLRAVERIDRYKTSWLWGLMTARASRAADGGETDARRQE